MLSKLPIAVQVYSVRDDAAADFKGTLQKLKDMGYDGVELAGLYGMTAAEVRAALDEVGIPAISAHVPYAELVADAEGTIAAYKEIGVQYIAFPYLGEEDRPGAPAFEETLKNMRHICEVGKEMGIPFLYHNHDFEFIKMENGQYGLDYMYDTIPADLLQTELDTCWVNVGGEVPAEYVRKYTGRAPIVHLKDFTGSKSENMYALIGTDTAKEDSAGKFEFRPVGYGKQDFPAILAAAEDAGAGWVVVEQDSPALGKTPLECAKMSIDYLKSIM